MDKVTLGGERLGGGKKMKVDLKSYNRSSHNLNQIVRTTMAAGTLVPFLKEVALRGDTFDIDLEIDVKTHPTVGPLFGSYKTQIDVFTCPIRLYKAELHNNMLGVGLNMQNVVLPRLRMTPTELDLTKPLDNQQINPSSLLAYLGIRGIARQTDNNNYTSRRRNFNAVPFLAYWDIYKNYYANKQEGIGAFIHTETVPLSGSALSSAIASRGSTTEPLAADIPAGVNDFIVLDNTQNSLIQVAVVSALTEVELGQLEFAVATTHMPAGSWVWENASKLWGKITRLGGAGTTFALTEPIPFQASFGNTETKYYAYRVAAAGQIPVDKPKIKTFPLENIDKMKEMIFKAYGVTLTLSDYADGQNKYSPYSDILLRMSDKQASRQFSQEGLGLKTYQSDLFNNWLSTEWIDGTNGINEITKVSTAGDEFSIDALNLAKKVYDMLNRIAVSGGSYDDWLEAVYPINKLHHNEIPKYEGGLIRELVFQEVISTAENQSQDVTQPLGTLAGRGIMGQGRKGGKMVIRVDEPSYIIGIVSITPRIDYSQGNAWDIDLKTMDDFHKPALDAIGFQDLITEQMAWWDTGVGGATDTLIKKSAGKQPAWINYMTAINRTYGNFAVEDNEMFMTLNRRYERSGTTLQTSTIKDLTTYIDPSKYNNIFADTAIDSQNFWVQIGADITARRLMSAKIIPNL